MRQFRENLDSYQKNMEGISKYTETWEKMRESIAQQVEALKEAAEALESLKKNPTKFILQLYPGAYEQGGLIRIPVGGDIEDDGKGWGRDDDDDGGYHYVGEDNWDDGKGWGNDSGGSKPSKSDDDDDSGYVYSGPGYQKDLEDAAREAMEAVGDVFEDYLESHTYHSGIKKGAIGESDNEKVDALKALSLRPLRPDEMPIIARMGEVMLNKEQQDQMISNLNRIYDESSYAPLFSGLSRLAPGLRQPENNMEVSFNGDIVIQGTQDPDGFAKALYKRIEPAMNQNFSKIFRS